MTENSRQAEGKQPMDHGKNEEKTSDVSLDDNSPELADSAVSVGDPPLVRRFKKNQSGNPRGRPKGSKNRKTIIRKIANEMHTITEDGKPRVCSTLELALLTLRNLAAEGNVSAVAAYDRLYAKYNPPRNRTSGVLLAPAPVTEEEAIKEAEEALAKMEMEQAARLAQESADGQ